MKTQSYKAFRGIGGNIGTPFPHTRAREVSRKRGYSGTTQDPLTTAHEPS